MRKLLIATMGVLASASVAFGQAFPNYPTVGVPADTECLSYGNNNRCTQYRPAGLPNLTGNETIPADTNLPGGQNPQTERIPLSLLSAFSQGSFTNALIGGDFNTNLWQRGTSFASATPTTAAYTADRWWMYSSANTVTVNRQTGAGDILLSAGVNAVMRVVRPSGTDVTPICVGQILPAKEATRFLGNNAIFSFYAMAGAGLSSIADSVDVTIAYATAADSATVNTNTDAFAKGTITGYTPVVTKASTGSVASGAANVPITTTMTRYYVSGAIPTTATTVGVKICMTNVGTGGSTDWFEFGNAQLEAGSPATASTVGQVSPGAFSRRPLAVETALQQSYSYGVTELTDHLYPVPVLCTATANAWITIQYPVQMRMTPTLALTAGGFSIQTAVAVTAIGTTTLLTATAQSAKLTSAAACTSTLPYQLKGTNTTGLIMFSAEP